MKVKNGILHEMSKTFNENFVCSECSELSYELDMYDDCDEGIDGDMFVDNLNQYVYDNHYDDKIDDIAKDWQLPRHELVKKVLNELKKE